MTWTPALLDPAQGFPVSQAMPEIPLTQGKVTVVDEADFKFLSQWKWRLNNGYAVRWTKKCEGFEPRRLIYMHRVISGVTEDAMCDHWNGNELDNRRGNLRFATFVQNGGNRKISKNNQCGFKGVCLHNGKYQASIRSVYLGRFSTPQEAHQAYAEAAAKLFGQFARN